MKSLDTNLDSMLSKEWKLLLYKAKKVVLYYTSTEALMSGGSKWIHKIQSVLESFRQHNDVMLWWRAQLPDKAASNSSSFELCDAYIKIIEGYKNEGFGIFDDTPDWLRAVAMSDVYYGDYGSIAEFYKTTRKPMIIQEIETPHAFSELGVKFPLTLSVYRNKLYYYLFSRNAIFKLDLKSFRPNYFGVVQRNPIFGENRLFHHTVIIDDKLYFVPFNGSAIPVFDFTKGLFEVYPLELREELKIKNSSNGNFYNLVLHKNMIFLLPFSYRAIIAYNRKTGKTVYCLDLLDVFPEFFSSDEYHKSDYYLSKVFFHQYVYLDASRILIPSLHSNVLLEFNLDDYTYAVHRMGTADVKLCSITKHNGYFWIVAINKPLIFKWNYVSGEIEELTGFPPGFGKNEAEKNIYYGRNEVLCYKNYLYLFPARVNMVCRVDMVKSSIEHMKEFDQYCVRGEEGDISFFDGSCLEASKIFLWHKDKMILEYDIEEREIRECKAPFNVSDVDYQRLSNDYFDSLVDIEHACYEFT